MSQGPVVHLYTPVAAGTKVKALKIYNMIYIHIQFHSQ